MDHYAEAFFVQPGQCWRMVAESDGSGRPTHCPEPVAWRGRYRTPRGKWHVVDSCDGHVDDRLVSPRAIASDAYQSPDS